MKKIRAILVLLLALAPYATVGVCFKLFSRGRFESAFLGNQSNGYFGPFEWILLAEWGVGLLLFTLHIQFNNRLDKQSKDSWRLKIWFFQIFGFLAYWYKFMWRLSE
jgi:hypothetical protein